MIMVLNCDEVGFSIFIQACAQCALVGDFQLAREHLHEPGLVEPAKTLQRDQRHGHHRLGRRGAHHTLVGCQRIEEGDYVVPRWLHHNGKSGHRPEGSKDVEMYEPRLQDLQQGHQSDR